MSAWSVVQTESQREAVAADYLSRGGFETYLPRIRIRDKARIREVALFPCYVFSRIGHFWFRARWSPGVLRVLMSDEERPAELADPVVEAIRKREGNDGFVKLPKPPSPRKKGDRVKIIRGSFEGHLALYEGQSSKDRERVLLDLLGQMVQVELPARDVINFAVERS